MNTESEMAIGSLAPWFGAKRTLAPAIVQELGPHSAYWEPFCGSMAVLMAKPAARMEIVNDLHDDLINLARCLNHREVGPKLYRQLRRTICDSRLYEDCFFRIRDEIAPLQSAMVGIHPGRAYDYFVSSWLCRNGMAGTRGKATGKTFSIRYTKGGGSSAKRFQSAVESIPAWRRRLRDVTVLSTDGIELCKKIEDAEGVVIYADPPYLKKSAQYLHDFDWLSHRRLAEALRRFKKTRVIVSYYEHPDLAAMYPAWTFRPIHTTKNLISAGQRGNTGATVAPEVLIINGPSLALETTGPAGNYEGRGE